MHLVGACAGVGARRLSEITRIVSEKDWRTGVGSSARVVNWRMDGCWPLAGSVGPLVT